MHKRYRGFNCVGQRGMVSVRRLTWVLGGVLLLWGASAATAAAASLTQEAPGSDGSIWSALVPLLTAAVSVERTIELGWNYIEWGLLRFVGWQPGDLKLPSYVQFKSGTSLLAGIILGILVSNYTGMRLLALLRPEALGLLDNVPPLWDIILTGLVIGAGSKPAHDILALITQLKNYFGNNALKQRELAGAALAEGIVRLGQANTAFTVEVPGAGPTPIGVGSARAARSRIAADTGQGEVEAPSLEDYANLLHNKLYS